MATGMNDFLQQVLGLVQARQSMEEQARLQRAQQAQMITMFANLARQTTNPEQLNALTKSFSRVSGVNEEALNEFARTTQPMTDVFATSQARAGLASLPMEQQVAMQRNAASAALTGARQPQVAQEEWLANLLPQDSLLGNALRARLAAGQDVGQLALSGRVAETLGQDEAGKQAANIVLGLGLSAPQAEQARQFGISTQVNVMDLLQRGALGQAGLEVQAAGLGLEAQKLAAMAEQTDDPVRLLELYQKSFADFEARKHSMSWAEQQRYVNLLNGVKFRLQRAGVIDPTEPPLQVGDVSGRPGFLDERRGSAPDASQWRPGYLPPADTSRMRR